MKWGHLQSHKTIGFLPRTAVCTASMIMLSTNSYSVFCARQWCVYPLPPLPRIDVTVNCIPTAPLCLWYLVLSCNLKIVKRASLIYDPSYVGASGFLVRDTDVIHFSSCDADTCITVAVTTAAGELIGLLGTIWITALTTVTLLIERGLKDAVSAVDTAALEVANLSVYAV